tara:strand:- start:25233 stop:26276 length:1044 start_codon:yes stop_codon:yes gene_type:complete
MVNMQLNAFHLTSITSTGIDGDTKMARQRGKKWQGDVKTSTKRHRKTFLSETEAELWEASVKLAIARGEPISSEGVSPSAESFTQYYRRVHSVLWGDTLHGMKVISQLNEIACIINDCPVSQITDQHIEDIVAALKQKRNADATINRKMASLSKILTQAKKTKVLADKPDIPRLKEGRGRLRFLSKEEETRLLDKLGYLRPEFADFTAFLIDTGFRFGEALKFTWNDYHDGKVTLWHTKSNKPRTIPLTQRCREILDRCSKDNHQPFSHINRNTYRTVFEKARAMAGLGEDVIPHVMRHTCASRLVQSGVDIRRVQVWLGHGTIAMTMRYSHLAPDDLDVCLEALEN